MMPNPSAPVVLLVEDEPFVRMCTADALTEGGFAVVEAQDAEEALEVVAAAAPFDLLFTDINLGGGLDGIQLARVIEEQRPGTRLVVTSGRERVRDEDLPDTGVFISKPYRTDQICEVLRSQLAR